MIVVDVVHHSAVIGLGPDLSREKVPIAVVEPDIKLLLRSAESDRNRAFDLTLESGLIGFAQRLHILEHRAFLGRHAAVT